GAAGHRGGTPPGRDVRDPVADRCEALHHHQRSRRGEREAPADQSRPQGGQERRVRVKGRTGTIGRASRRPSGGAAHGNERPFFCFAAARAGHTTGGKSREPKGGAPMEIMGILTLVNLFFAVVIGLYFWNLLRQQQTSRSAVERESRKELEKLAKLKAISLTEPLAEKTRPSRFEEIVGQEDGLKALRAALCGPNPQHVIIYGPPGVGKTAAARLVLEE